MGLFTFVASVTLFVIGCGNSKTAQLPQAPANTEAVSKTIKGKKYQAVQLALISTLISDKNNPYELTVSQTLPPPYNGCPSATISHSRLKRDDEMGQSLIQFTDDYETVYGITAANIKRKTR